MAVIKIKRSQTVGIPTKLASGELAYSALPNNGTNGGDTLYIGFGPETAGNAAQKIAIGGKRYTDAINAATSLSVNNTLVSRDASGNFIANQITANLIGNASTANKWLAPISLSISGDATTTITGLDGSQNVTSQLTLTNSGVNPGTYGTSTGIPIITVDQKGRVTQVTTVSPADQLTPTGVQAGSYGAGSFIPVITVNAQGRITDVQETAVLSANAAASWSTARDITITGDLSGTIASLDGSQNISAQLTLANTGVISGTYGGTGQVPVISVDSKGRVTSLSTAQIANADAASKWSTARNISFIGDVTGTITGLDGSQNITAGLYLGTTGVTPGTYGSINQVPSFTVDSDGRITSVSAVNIQTTSSIELIGNTGQGTITNSLSVIGTGPIVTSVSNNVLSIGINLPQQVNTNSNVNFNSLNLTGSLTVGGSLTVNGTVTTVNSETVSIADKNIELAKNASGSAQADGAGITVMGPVIPATLLYQGTFDRWSLNKDLVVPKVIGDLQGNASSSDKWSRPIELTFYGDVSGFVGAIDGSSISVAAGLTLTAVNTSAGTWGSAYSIPRFNVNNKGQITSVSELNIPAATSNSLGLASFNTASFVVSSGAVSLSEVDCGIY